MSEGAPVGYTAPLSPMAIGLRVADVRQALVFYRRLGFVEDMVVPDGDGRPQFCHMRYGTSSLVFDAIESELPSPICNANGIRARGRGAWA